MADDLEQRIERALELLKFIWEGPFIHGVICDMKREREQMQEQRDVAIKHLIWLLGRESPIELKMPHSDVEAIITGP